ncbi:MAG: VOC family protein [Puniceicoccales bacterium]
MIAHTVPQFFTSDFEKTFAYYEEKLGFERQFLYGEPAVYGGMMRDGQSIFFRYVEQALPTSPEKYAEELLDTYIIVEGVDAVFQEFTDKGVDFHRGIETMPWAFREFVVRDEDGRLLCFGEFVGG